MAIVVNKKSTGTPSATPIAALVSSILETAAAPTTFVTGVLSLGDQMLVGGQPHRKVYMGNNDENLFSYVIDRPLVIPCDNVSIPTGATGLNNSNLNKVKLGSIKIPGDSLRHADSVTMSITVTASTAMPPGQISIGLSRSRTQEKYHTSRAWDSTRAGKSETMEVTLTTLHASVVRLDKVQDATAPTAYPNPAQVVDVNTLANVEIPIYFQFLAPRVTPSSSEITGMTAEIRLEPPKRFQLQANTVYRKPYLQPFASDDVFNSPVLTNAVAPGVVLTHDWASTAGQNNAAGTINAQGTKDSPVVTLARTAGLKPGMFPMMGGVYATYAQTDAAAQFSAGNLNIPALTKDVFGVGNKILSVDSATQITMEKPLVADLMQRGREASGFYRCVLFYPNAETLSLHMAQGAGSSTVGQLTGITKNGANNAVAKAWPLEFPVLRMRSTDPLRQLTVGKVVAPNGWLSAITDVQASGDSNESIKDTVLMLRIPAKLTQVWFGSQMRNADRNVALITECGRYSIELYLLNQDVATNKYSCNRAVVTDMMGRCTPNILDRAEVMNSGISYGTRAYGGGLIGGVIRFEEWLKIPTTPTTLETDAVIIANLAIAAAAIPHAPAMVLGGAQLKSPNYCPNPAVQGTKLSYYSYISQFNKHTPAIKEGGTGYALGDVVYVEGGDFNAQLRCKVVAVAAGVPTRLVTVGTGQYRTPPPDAANLATTSSGAGIGLILDATNLPGDPSINTTALAFPATATSSLYVFPATVADSAAVNTYSGSFPMGGMATIPKERDLEAEWLWGRKANPSNKRYSYELYAVLKAIQRFGLIVVDMANTVHNPVVVDADIAASANYVNLHGDTGAYSFPGLQEIKSRIVYIENASMFGKGIGAAPRPGASFAAPLHPINN